MTPEYKLAIFFFVLILISAYAIMQYAVYFYKEKKKIEDTKPKPTKYKDVGVMEGSWVVNGVRQPVRFCGRYYLINGRETTYNAEDLMNGKLEYAKQKRGFIWSHHPYAEDYLIPISAISEISVRLDSNVITLEEDEEDED